MCQDLTLDPSDRKVIACLPALTLLLLTAGQPPLLWAPYSSPTTTRSSQYNLVGRLTGLQLFTAVPCGTVPSHLQACAHCAHPAESSSSTSEANPNGQPVTFRPYTVPRRSSSLRGRRVPNGWASLATTSSSRRCGAAMAQVGSCSRGCLRPGPHVDVKITCA